MSDQARVIHPFARIVLNIVTQHHSKTELWLREVTAKVGRHMIFHSRFLLLIMHKIPEVSN